uniref:Dual oxidase maturation factor 1 n=1 Tax=Timema poppense TaxID=170557 RepID=A0A7R9DN00_TIMPO|nr:unnamed protein product [Timema poppensis]
MFEHLFHLARHEFGFTYYNSRRPVPAFFYLNPVFVALLVTALASAGVLLFLLPSVRRKLATLYLGWTMIGTGAAIGYCLIIPEWQYGSVELPYGSTRVSYWPSSGYLVPKSSYALRLSIGIHAANFTLYAYGDQGFYYDEVISFNTQETIYEQYLSALRRGLPEPLLVLMEQVAATETKGFVWPYRVRLAGHYTSWALYFALGLWVISLLTHPSLPLSSAEFLTCSGLLLQSCPALYAILLKGSPRLDIYVSGCVMALRYGACFWTCLACGVVATLTGVGMMIQARRDSKMCLTTFNVTEGSKAKKHDKRHDVVFQEEEETAYHKGVNHTQN